jgi:ABC-type transport system involved in multi-copper enzyme maturation permease subunit
MSLHGVTLVARQELRTRLRTGRWRLLLAVWFVVVNGLGLLFRLSLGTVDSAAEMGVPMFGGVLLGVLMLVMLVAPALTAQSINGERERGTLATLQVTALTPGDIAWGKLAAAWGTGLVVLGLTLPSVAWPVVMGATSVVRAIAVLAVTALLIGVVCAVSQGWSALTARSVTSSLLSYLTVFALQFGTLIAFALALPLTTTTETVYDENGTVAYVDEDQHPERVWWLLAPNPFVVLADAAPRLPERRPGLGDVGPEPFDPLGDIGRSVREARDQDRDRFQFTDDEAAPVWPYGLAANLGLAGGAMWITTRRLRTPAQSLPSGVRLA